MVVEFCDRQGRVIVTDPQLIRRLGELDKQMAAYRCAKGQRVDYVVNSYTDLFGGYDGRS